MCNFAIIGICLCTRGNGGEFWGRWGLPFFLNWMKPYPLSAEVKFSQQSKPCALDECSRKHRAPIQRVLPAAITAEPWRIGLGNFIQPFNTRAKKGAWGFLPIPTAACGCSNLYGLTAHPVIADHTHRTIKRWGMTGICLEAALAALWHGHMLNSPLTTALCVTLCNLQCFVL